MFLLAQDKAVILSVVSVALCCFVISGCKNDIKSHDKQASTNTKETQTTLMQNIDSTTLAQQVNFPQHIIDMFSHLNTDLNATPKIAKSNKMILLFFGSPFCLPCKTLSTSIIESKPLQNALKSHYISYFIDISSKESINPNLFYLLTSLSNLPKHAQTTQAKTTQDTHTAQMSQKELASNLHIRATPTLLFLGENGEEVFRFVGGISTQRLLAMLDFLPSAHSLNQQQIALELHLRFMAQSEANKKSVKH